MDSLAAALSLENYQEYRRAREELEQEDPDFAEWVTRWRDLRRETKDKFRKCTSKTWLGFQASYNGRKSALQANKRAAK